MKKNKTTLVDPLSNSDTFHYHGEEYIVRKPEINTKKKPKLPLTRLEREKLEREELDYCIKAYVSKFKVSKSFTTYDEVDDLKTEAFLFMRSCFDKFDKKRLGKIAKKDKEGKKSEKTLNFYFKNFFNTRINYLSLDIINSAKKAGQISTVESEFSDDLFESLEKNFSTTLTGGEESEMYTLLTTGAARLSKPAQIYFNYKLLNQFTVPQVKKILMGDYQQAKLEVDNYIKNFKQDIKSPIEKE